MGQLLGQNSAADTACLGKYEELIEGECGRVLDIVLSQVFDHLLGQAWSTSNSCDAESLKFVDQTCTFQSPPNSCRTGQSPAGILRTLQDCKPNF